MNQAELDARAAKLVRRMRLAGALVSAGLVVQGATLVWINAVSFVVFAAGGGTLVALGIAVYLHAAANR